MLLEDRQMANRETEQSESHRDDRHRDGDLHPAREVAHSGPSLETGDADVQAIDTKP